MKKYNMLNRIPSIIKLYKSRLGEEHVEIPEQSISILERTLTDSLGNGATKEPLDMVKLKEAKPKGIGVRMMHCIGVESGYRGRNEELTNGDALRFYQRIRHLFVRNAEGKITYNDPCSGTGGLRNFGINSFEALEWYLHEKGLIE